MRKIHLYARFAPLFLLFVMLFAACGSTEGVGQTQPTATSPQTVPTTAPASVPTGIPTSTPATSSPTSSNYSAAQPGPGCDTNGGTWTAQGLSGISCGTWVTNSTANTWGYLFLQLPNNAAFAANNKISITLSNIDSLNSSCIGLAEIGQNSGYLVAYCQNGGNNEWTIYSISDQGTIIQPLSSNATSIRTNTTLSLTVVDNTLTFAIDVESHHISISPLLPTKIAIAFYNNGCGNCTAETSNFNYLTPPS